MHTNHPTPRRARKISRRAAIAVTTGAAVVTMLTPSIAEAGPKTESGAIAAAAEAALDALERWNATGRPAAYAEFVEQRELAASVIATQLEVPADALLDEWDEAEELKQVAMLSAFTQLGVPYRSMASKPGVGFDCSGLTTWAYREAGVELPRISGEQIRAADQVDEVDAEPGDLAYYPGHVSIYVGQGLMVHSPNSGNRVEVRHVPTRSQRFGDAFSDELLAANGITSGDAPVRAPVDGADSETDSEAGHSGRHYWDRSWG